MREYTRHLMDENRRTKGRTITDADAHNAHTRTTVRHDIPTITGMRDKVRDSVTRAMNSITTD